MKNDNFLLTEVRGKYKLIRLSSKALSLYFEEFMHTEIQNTLHLVSVTHSVKRCLDLFVIPKVCVSLRVFGVSLS